MIKLNGISLRVKYKKRSQDGRRLQMERVELQTKIFIGGDGANGNEGIN